MHLIAVIENGTMTLLKILWAGMFMTPSAEAFAKFSITLMLVRITTSKRWAYFFYTLIGLFAAVTIVTLAADVTQCKPLAFLWDPLSHPTGSCDQAAEISTAYLQGGKSSNRSLKQKIVTDRMFSRCRPLRCCLGYLAHLLALECTD